MGKERESTTTGGDDEQTTKQDNSALPIHTGHVQLRYRNTERERVRIALSKGTLHLTHRGSGTDKGGEEEEKDVRNTTGVVAGDYFHLGWK